MLREELWRCTGVEGYGYDLLCDVDDAHVRSYCQSASRKAAQIAKHWTQQLANEWAIRNYLAVKMILASQLLLNVASYSQRKNIVLTHPYLLYYTLLNTCRAFLSSDITIDWRDGNLHTAGHDWIRKTTANGLQRLSPGHAQNANALIYKARKQRELFSYSFPASGPIYVPGGLLRIDDVYPVAGLLCELAEVNSESLEAAWRKHSGQVLKVEWLQLSDFCGYDAGVQMIDGDDHYRLGYLTKYSGPVCLVSIGTAGMIEDFFAAWCASDDETEPDSFDPDSGGAPALFDFQ
jgi:hypothetical protein